MKWYFFGIYHWRRGLRATAFIPLAIVLLLVATTLPLLFALLVVGISVAFATYGLKALNKLLKPRPWDIEQEKYDRLNESLQIEDADTILDFGCGTGRSLVGISSHVSDSSRVLALDRFDDRIIMGNTPAVASRNARVAGLSTQLLRGDGRLLPVRTDSVNAVIVSQVLHDLPEAQVETIASELHRICAPDGRLGLIELPLINDEPEVEPEFWEETVERAGFDVVSKERMGWKPGSDRALIVATPAPAHQK